MKFKQDSEKNSTSITGKKKTIEDELRYDLSDLKD